MNKHPEILAKYDKKGCTSLFEHLRLVAFAADKMSDAFNLDKQLVRKGALIHDIGKSSNEFQKRLIKRYSPEWEPFRHEIASLFFLPIFPKEEWPALIEMIIAHHKSIVKDGRSLGFLDLDMRYEEGVAFENHYSEFSKWSVYALEILNSLGIVTKAISKDDANYAYGWSIKYCRQIESGWSRWRGILMAADHLASAISEQVEVKMEKLFKIPDLSFYNRTSWLYPLSKIQASCDKPYTLVTAPTGAGKTDFLLRRCSGRVFYTLPFQASINAMYERFCKDLENTMADIRLLHASSEIILEGKSREDRALQNMVGSSIKVLTPHQLAGIVFGTKDYESLLLDLEGNDIILDEIHTYTEISQAIVLKLIEILKSLNCRIHIGTATMPSLLYEKILELLGKNEVYEVRLGEEVIETFNRHIIHKIENWDIAFNNIENALSKKEKILLVVNRVKSAQELFEKIKNNFPNIPMMLIHSRFKRQDRAELERRLKNEFNLNSGPCFVVSTQVVEVSLDISFDLMITECAPLDSLIQRFGRINRKRDNITIGKYKPIYVIAPPESKKDALPYELDILNKSYSVLPDGELLHEKTIIKLLDQVYTTINMQKIDIHTKYKNQKWCLKKLAHEPKSALFDLLEIDSAVCILESDKESYKNLSTNDRIKIEIPISFNSICYLNLSQIDLGHRPFIIPNNIYSNEIGLAIHNFKKKDNGSNFIF